MSRSNANGKPQGRVARFMMYAFDFAVFTDTASDYAAEERAAALMIYLHLLQTAASEPPGILKLPNSRISDAARPLASRLSIDMQTCMQALRFLISAGFAERKGDELAFPRLDEHVRLRSKSAVRVERCRRRQKQNGKKQSEQGQAAVPRQAPKAVPAPTAIADGTGTGMQQAASAAKKTAPKQPKPAATPAEPTPAAPKITAVAPKKAAQTPPPALKKPTAAAQKTPVSTDPASKASPGQTNALQKQTASGTKPAAAGSNRTQSAPPAAKKTTVEQTNMARQKPKAVPPGTPGVPRNAPPEDQKQQETAASSPGSRPQMHRPGVQNPRPKFVPMERPGRSQSPWQGRSGT